MDDLIRRSDAIAEIRNAVIAKIRHARTPNVVLYQYAELFINAVYRAPTTDRPQGKWIVNMTNYESLCSVCGAKETAFIYGTEMWYGLGESKFCPSCGARMKGADDE